MAVGPPSRRVRRAWRPHFGDIRVTARTAAALTAGAVALVVVRRERTGASDYDFLIWNLFLAWLPFGFAAAAVRLRRLRFARAAYYPAALLWLAFFPNAPYIVTDFVHLRIQGTGHLAIDVPMLAAAAAAGMVLAIGSLRLMHDVVRSRLGDLAGWLFVSAAATLVAFGVYLGRVLRWNSWQLFSHPGQVAADAWTRVAHPFMHQRALGGTALFALAFLLAYALVGAARRPRRRA